jgi:glycosyltransferase involved in cell wall biosynthesis
MKKKILRVSVGVFAYNEAANIGFLLDALLSQKLQLAQIDEIIVVSSASTDGTDEIVSDYSRG